MCDTLYLRSMGPSAEGPTIFAKNSDREPNEIQLVEFYPRTEREGKLKVTDSEVEFEGRTNAILISRPCWMWGAEMGINEYGVAIGNEALFTKRKHSSHGLLGMDLLRIALEKGQDTERATEAIVEYLEKYGQGGSNSVTRKLYYDNSFLVADKNTSAVIETVGPEWRIIKTGSRAAISNISLDFAVGPAKDAEQSANFSLRHDKLYTGFGKGILRQGFTSSSVDKLSQSNSNQLEGIMQVLRSHSSEFVHPSTGSNSDVCMHAGPLSRINQTTNSMIIEIGQKRSVVWSTFSSNPCLSLFKPMVFANAKVWPPPYSEAYWVASERTHRALANCDPDTFQAAMKATERSQRVVNEVFAIARPAATQHTEYGRPPAVNEEIERIDKDHVSSLFSLSSEQNLSGKPFYRNWWKRMDKGLSTGTIATTS